MKVHYPDTCKASKTGYSNTRQPDQVTCKRCKIILQAQLFRAVINFLKPEKKERKVAKA